MKRTVWLAEYRVGTLGLQDWEADRFRFLRILRNPLRIPEPEDSYLLRWGLSRPVIGEDKVAETLNPASAVMLTANKVKMKQALLEKGIPTPALLSTGQDLVVKNIYHCGGRGTSILRKKYIEEFVPTVGEYRVYVAFRRTLVRQKVLVGEYQGTLNRGETLIRSFSRGWRVRYVPLNEGESMAIRAIAKNAVEALGLHIGVVDVGVSDGPRYWVFEVNSGANIEAPYVLEWVRSRILEYAYR